MTNSQDANYYGPSSQGPKLGKRGNRTPRSEMLFRMCVAVGLPGFAFICFFKYMSGAEDINLFIMFLACIGGVLTFSFAAWAFINFTANMIYKNDEGYKRFRESGGDPYFDQTGAFLLVGGCDDPDTAFDGGWDFVDCPNCGHNFCVNQDACPNCGAQKRDMVVCEVCETLTYIPGPTANCCGCGTLLRKT